MRSRPRGRGRALSFSLRRRRLRLLFILTFLMLLSFLSLHFSAAALRRANALGRRCSLRRPLIPSSRRYRIAMVSFSSSNTEPAAGKRRSFEGLMEVVAGNKREYADRLGYDFVDARDLVEPSRPPSWSKILAVQSCLRRYDWVFWNDADTVVTNPEISLESILWAVIGHDEFDASPDLILTKDINSVNAGVFFFRRSKWSEDFLNKWWNQTIFIRFGSTRSGDNAALQYLIDSLSPKEFQDHVRVSPMQCLFNSYPWFPTWKSAFRLISSPHAAWKGSYSEGDFMVHLAGIDEKKKWVSQILHEIKAEK